MQADAGEGDEREDENVKMGADEGADSEGADSEGADLTRSSATPPQAPPRRESKRRRPWETSTESPVAERERPWETEERLDARVLCG